MERLLLTVSEGMEATRLGRTKFYELIASKQIPSVRIGKSLRIPSKALEEWVRNKQTEASNDGDEL